MARRRCHYCNKARGATVDHIVPKALGGPNARWNYVEACQTCNSDKGSDWPSCPCGICSLAVEMFLWAKERGLPPMPTVFVNADQVKARAALLALVLSTFRERLWEERITRMERWEDAAWLGDKSYVYDGQKGRTKVTYDPPPNSALYEEWAATQEWDEDGWQVRR